MLFPTGYHLIPLIRLKTLSKQTQLNSTLRSPQAGTTWEVNMERHLTAEALNSESEFTKKYNLHATYQ